VADKSNAFTYLAPADPSDPPVGNPAPPAPVTPTGPANPGASVGSVTGLKAKRTKAGKVAVLKWTAVAKAVRYEFGCAVKGKKVTTWTPVTRTKAVCLKLKPPKAYRGYVRAVGQNSFSAPVSVKIRRWR
jgi:hypothetical protein